MLFPFRTSWRPAFPDGAPLKHVPLRISRALKKAHMAFSTAVAIVSLLILLGFGTLASGGSELEVLLVFKNQYLTNASTLRSWDEQDASPCGWRGVRCSGTSGKVTALILDGMSLSGRISGTLANLSGLEILSLSRNNLSGTLPEAITQMPSLRKLNASYNALSGSIPTLYGGTGTLEHLDLSFNSLTGQIPLELFSSNKNLRTIALSGNQLRGGIPESMYDCYLLQVVNVSSNKISGSLSEQVGHLRSLQVLDLSWNGVAGGIPLGISSLRYLNELRLTGNYLSGQIPRGLTHCANLQALDLSFNDLSGSLASQLQSLSALRVLNLRKNYLSGTIPTWISTLTSLELLDLAENMFSGSLPPSLGLLVNLQSLSLSRNSLTGRIPDGLGNLLQLSVVDLGYNQLAQSIPSRLITHSLQFLSLSHNLLSGGISVGGCKSLKVLDLSRNLLTGQLPAEIGSCSALAVLNVSENSFSSSLPIGIGSVTSLQVLDTSRNSFSGVIPNNLCTHTRLRSLRAQHNLLSGSIPVDVGHCLWLEDLNLSSNHLGGAIPQELANVTRLKFLDLSHNRLSGYIPAQLSHLRNLVMIDVSNNLLHGLIPNGSVFSSMNTTAYAGNPGLCGSAINVTCAPPVPSAISPRASQIRGQLPSPGTEGRRVLLSVSAIVAIAAAASIAVGAILAAAGSLRAQKGIRCSTIRMRSMPDRSSRVLAVGKLFLFSRSRWFRSRSWANEYLLLHKHSEMGHGGFGVVYQAVLPDGETVAVKKLAVAGSAKSRDEFEREVRLLGKVRHHNLVQLKGYYWTEQVQLLLYAYVPCGDLGRRLHEPGHGQPILDWSTRFKIAKGAALGLAHLHRCNPQIIHYNVKASNILLDVGNTPRISDFGLFKLVPMLDAFSMSSSFQNALGYKAPEFASDILQIGEKSDVYGFGVVLLELVTGRRPVEYMENDIVHILCDSVRTMLAQGQGLACIDPNLNLHDTGVLLPFLKLGVICTSHIAAQRPSMAEVVDMLELMTLNSF